MTRHKIVVTQCDERAMHGMVADSTDYAGRYTYQQCSPPSALDIFTKYVYLEERLQTYILYLFQCPIICYAWVVSVRCF
jgi:hypothetical protein